MNHNFENQQTTEILPNYRARHIQAIQLFQSGKSTKEIAEILRVNVRTVQRYLQKDLNMINSEKRLPGNQNKLSEHQLNNIKNTIALPAREARFLASEWTPRILKRYIWDEYRISISREKARQLLLSNRSIYSQKSSELELKEMSLWEQNDSTAIWLISHLYLGKQNRQSKFKNKKKTYIDDDLLKTKEELESQNIDATKKARSQIAICALNMKTNDIRCILVDRNADEKKQVKDLYVKAANLSRKKKVIFLTTKSGIVGRTLETQRLSLYKKSISLEFLPSASITFDPLRHLKRSILTKFSLLDHRRVNGRIQRSSKAKEFAKNTQDYLISYFQEISTF